MIQRWLLFWLLASSTLAYAAPGPWIATRGALGWLITGIMFCIGLMLPRREVADVVRRWPSVLAGSALQYAIMPSLAFAIGWLWKLDGPDLAGLLVVGCVPGAMASNVLTLNAKGHTSYSVGLTTTSTLLSPIVTPLALAAGLQLSPEQAEAFSGWTASVTMLQTVVAPVIIGFVTQRLVPAIEPAARQWCPTLANLLILWVIAVVVALNRDRLAQSSAEMIPPLILLNILGYAGGYFGGWALRLPESMRRALTLEVGMQNAGAGAFLAAKTLGEASALAPAIYTFGCMLTGVLLARIWANRPTAASTTETGGRDQ